METVVEGTVTDHPTYQPKDSNTVYRSLQVGGINASLPQAWTEQLPPLGSKVRMTVLPKGQNKMTVVSVAPVREGGTGPLSSNRP